MSPHTTPFAMHLTDAQVAFVVNAIRHHRELYRRNRQPLPGGIDDLTAVLRSGVREGHSGSPVADAEPSADSRTMAPLATTYEDAAQSLGISLSTFKRRVLNRELTPVTIGGQKRIRVADLDALVATITPTQRDVLA